MHPASIQRPDAIERSPVSTRFISSLATFAFLITISACGGDDPIGNGPHDTKPPAVASVTAIDAYHIEIVFDEALKKSSAEGYWHYWIEDPAAPAHDPAAGAEDPIWVTSAMLASDQKTVSLGTYTPMADIDYEINITDVADIAGNVMVDLTRDFPGNSAADVTPPEMVSRTPLPNAVNVPVGIAVAIKFSENISVENATWISNDESVLADPWTRGDKLTMSPNHTLTPGSDNMVTLSGVQDLSGNMMPNIQWSFTITTAVDNTPPQLVSSVPANLATHVGVNTNLSLTFSEPLHPDTRWVTITPYLDIFLLGDLDDDGRTLVVESGGWLKDNQQYTVWLEPSYFRDLSGNTLKQATSITFTTGGLLASGSIAGRLTGDPGTGAADPTGASVVASGYARVATAVAENDSYQLKHVPDDTYEIVATKDSNLDGDLDFYFGDATGIYGVDLAVHDWDPDSVTVSGGAQVGAIGFPIYDPSAVSGVLSYSGLGFPYIRLYRIAGFDPHNPDEALVETQAGVFHDQGAAVHEDPWSVNSLINEFPDGDYYVVAFLDVDDDWVLDPSTDPYNWYGGPGAPIPVHLANGGDVFDIFIALPDSPPAAVTSIAGSTGSRRMMKKPNALFQHLGEVVRKSQQRVDR